MKNEVTDHVCERVLKKLPTSSCCLVVFSVENKYIAIGAGDLRFNYRAGQIGYSVANASFPLRRFVEAVLLRC